MQLRARSGSGGEPLAQRVTDIRAAQGLEQIRGIEGSAATEYFERMMAFNRSEFVWSGRRKYPAPDALNALLSLAYTLLMTELAGLLESHGLDPYLGFLHQPDHGRVSVALDLLEPFRAPIADRFVLRVVNLRVFQAKDFVGAGEGDKGRSMYLVPEALARFLAHWERWLEAEPRALNGLPPAKPFRRELRREVESLVRHWRGEREWRPWTWDRQQRAEEDECDSLSATT